MMFHCHIIKHKISFISNLLVSSVLYCFNIILLIKELLMIYNNCEQPTNTTCDDKLPPVPFIENLCRFLLPCHIGEP